MGDFDEVVFGLLINCMVVSDVDGVSVLVGFIWIVVFCVGVGGDMDVCYVWYLG